MKKHFFIDLDGTLTDISNRHYGVYASCVDELGGLPIPKEQYWDMKRDNIEWSNILSLSGLKVIDELIFIDKFISKIETTDWLRIDTLLPGVTDTLDNLSREYSLILVSLRRDRRELLDQLRNLSIDKYFTLILSGHSDTKRGTLNKKAEIIREFEYSKEDIIIGDTEADIAAGKQLGIRSFAVITGIRSKSFLDNQSPDYIIPIINDVIKFI